MSGDVPLPEVKADRLKGNAYLKAENREYKKAFDDARLDTLEAMCVSVVSERLPVSASLELAPRDARDGAFGNSPSTLAVRVNHWGPYTLPGGAMGVWIELECVVRNAQGKKIAMVAEEARIQLRLGDRKELAYRPEWETVWIALKEAIESATERSMLALRKLNL